MANANFITQFEYRLNNLTGSETQADLLSLRATADKYVDDLDTVAVALLDAAIDLDADALTNSSTIKELVTVGNADAEIKRSGGGVPINGVLPLSEADLKYVAPDSTEWLRSGFLETDIANYPDATINIGDLTGYSTGFDISTEVLNSGAVSFDPITERFYVLDNSNFYTCQIYDKAGNHLGATATLTGGLNTSVSSFVVYNNKIFALEGKIIYEYDETGAYQSTLTYPFNTAASSYTGASSMGYDPATDSFFATTTSGLGGSFAIDYVNQTTGDSDRLGQTPSISGYSPYGVCIAFGKVFAICHSGSADTGRIYSDVYKGPSANSWLESLSLTVTSNPYDATYGITATNEGLFSSSRTTDTIVNIDAAVGVGVVNEETLNGNADVFYYARIK